VERRGEAVADEVLIRLFVFLAKTMGSREAGARLPIAPEARKLLHSYYILLLGS
jgi:hypothetical protein